MNVYTPPTVAELNDTIAKERQRANDAWAATMMEREVAEAYKADALRYRWLRAANSIMPGAPGKRPIEWYCGTDADEAIDRAIHAATGRSGT